MTTDEITFDDGGIDVEPVPVEPVVEVPTDFDINIYLHPNGGVYRRYAAGVRSILDRANLVVSWTVERVQARHYPDEDLEVRFEAGDLVQDDGHDNAIEQRLATVVGVVAWHRTGGDNLTDRPLYTEDAATIRVISRTAEAETTFRVRPAEMARIKERIRDVIFRDHLLAVTREGNAWRMEPD